MWCLRRMEKIKWPEKITNEVLEGRREEGAFNNILRTKANWDLHIAFIVMPLKDG